MAPTAAGLRRDRSALADPFWLDDIAEADRHVGFRGTVQTSAGRYQLRAQAVATFRVWIDDELLIHGPVRYAPAGPEVAAMEVVLTAGVHRIHLEAHEEGVVTRTTPAVAAFAWADLTDAAGHRHPIDWSARSLADHYPPTGRRISPLLGWIEEQNLQISDWRSLPDDDPEWRRPVPATRAREQLGPALATTASAPRTTAQPITAAAAGRYVDTYGGYVLDDPAVQFMLADPAPDAGLAPDGHWWRYDLGEIRIGALELAVDCEQDAVVIVGYADRLGPDARPAPVIALSTGPTAFLQRFRVGPGRTRIRPLQSLGGRHLEVRIETRGEAAVVGAAFGDRDGLGEPSGTFSCDDPLLERIWRTGIVTQRRTTEDSIVDSVRERGEWLGDVTPASHGIIQAGWGGTAHLRRTVMHAALGARSDGLVAGCGPGEMIHVGSYAAQWTAACLAIADAEHSTDLLHELLPAARRNVDAIRRAIDDDGRHRLPWSFVDWGYHLESERPDVAVLSHAAVGVGHWMRWLRLVDRSDEAAAWEPELQRLRRLIEALLPAARSPYQATTLAVHAGVVDPVAAAPTLLAGIRRGFPFDPDAPRLRNPSVQLSDAVTPYFTNYSVPVLLEAGLGPEVRQLWATGWGWMLDQGATTWWEVFDHRWSRCHAWSGAPTWQLSRHVLGLSPSPQLGAWRLRVNTLGLDRASGAIPVSGGLVEVDWRRDGDELVWSAQCPVTLTLEGESPRSGRIEHRLRRLRGDRYGPDPAVGGAR